MERRRTKTAASQQLSNASHFQRCNLRTFFINDIVIDVAGMSAIKIKITVLAHMQDQSNRSFLPCPWLSVLLFIIFKLIN